MTTPSYIIRSFSLLEEGIKEKFEAIIQEHWEEVQRKFPEEEFALNWTLLHNMERMGLGGFIGAFAGEEILGYYAIMLVPSLTTKALKTGQDMGWFVKKEYRKGRIGINLLKAAEKLAEEKGCRENAISIKILRNKRPGELLALVGYECSEHRHTKQLKGA